MRPSLKGDAKPLGLIWIDCPPSVGTAGLVHALEEQAQVYTGDKFPAKAPSIIIVQASDKEDLADSVERHQRPDEDAAPILVFSSHLNLPLAREALRSGASGFIHAGMKPDQLVRAVAVASKGDLAAPRELIGFLIAQEEPADLANLSARQREILELVVEGRSNAEIGRRLFLSESTVKQHLRAAYKLLGVSNRTEAANLIRRDR